jgi:hypothetical protein
LSTSPSFDRCAALTCAPSRTYPLVCGFTCWLALARVGCFRLSCGPGDGPWEVAAGTADPFETEARARAAARHITSQPPGTGAWQAGSHRLLCEALAAAGVELGAYDHQIVQWLAGWEPQT